MRDILGEVIDSGFDLTAWVDCVCGEYRVFVSEGVISRCAGCGRGYMPSLSLNRYQPDEGELLTAERRDRSERMR